MSCVAWPNQTPIGTASNFLQCKWVSCSKSYWQGFDLGWYKDIVCPYLYTFIIFHNHTDHKCINSLISLLIIRLRHVSWCFWHRKWLRLQVCILHGASIDLRVEALTCISLHPWIMWIPATTYAKPHAAGHRSICHIWNTSETWIKNKRSG